MTRTYPLWALFAGIVVACIALARRRGVSEWRFLSAWFGSSVLLWLLAGVLGYLGGALQGIMGASPEDMVGFSIGAPLGALVGAPLGIALSERSIRRAWPRRPALALAAIAVALAAAAVLLILSRLGGGQQRAGYSVLVVFPMLGAAAVLGWLAGEKP
jgi:hypothetical protein